MADNSGNNGQQTVVVVQNAPSPVMGILSIVFSIISFFFFAILFVPLGLIFGIIAIVKKQTGLGITGIILAIISACLSPTFWGMFAAMGIISTAP